MIKRYRLAIALFLTCALGLQAADSGSEQQQVDSRAAASAAINAAINNVSIKNPTTYSYTDYALLGGAGYLMFLYSCFIARDALIAVRLGLNLTDLDRLARFLTYSAENAFKLGIVGGLTYKTVAAHTQQEAPSQEIATVEG